MLNYLEVVDGIEAVDGRNAAELETEEQGAVVGACVAYILPHQHEVGPSRVRDIMINNKINSSHYCPTAGHTPLLRMRRALVLSTHL